MKVFKSDRGREYVALNIEEDMKKKAIKFEESAPYTPQQNGKAERENRTLVECTRTMLHAKGMGLSFWAEAINTAVYTLNRTLNNKNLDKTPYEQWYQMKQLSILGFLDQQPIYIYLISKGRT